MARTKRKGIKSNARKMAAKRKQETPEQRAARLESMRNYARHCRENETESQREERLKSMRRYSRTRREAQKDMIRRQRVALIIERCKDAHESDTSEHMEPINFVKVEMD